MCPFTWSHLRLVPSGYSITQTGTPSASLTRQDRINQRLEAMCSVALTMPAKCVNGLEDQRECSQASTTELLILGTNDRHKPRYRPEIQKYTPGRTFSQLEKAKSRPSACLA